MLRFYSVIFFALPLVIYYILAAEYYVKHEEKYDEFKCYQLALRIVRSVKRRARIETIAIDADKLPQEGGYIMYSNHQGKYDALGIMDAHKEPCSVVMDAERSRVILTNSVIKLIRGKRLERHNLRQQTKELMMLTEETKNGRRYIYFPEGGYERNGNRLQEFRPGAFKCAKMAQVPIVPVAIYDSHLPFDYNSFRKVTTQVCFMDPIPYEEYKDKTTQEISAMVKELIEDKLTDLEENRKANGYNRGFKIYQN